MKFIISALLVTLVATATNAAPYNYVRQPVKKINAKEANPKVYQQAKDLEAVLISVMVDPMFPKGKESGLYGGGTGSDVYRSMMIQQYGKVLANGTNLGLAENITKKLTN
jgi:Rod binding domain-containing protein